MKKIYSICSWLCLLVASAFITACSGSSDDNDGTSSNPNLKDAVMNVSVDSTTIEADGVSKATFTVKLGDTDVSHDDGLTLVEVTDKGETILPAGDNTFTAILEGEYKIKVRYSKGDIKKESDKTTTITAVAPKAAMPYYQLPLAVEFTAVGCVNCPQLAGQLESILDENPYAFTLISFHMPYDNVPDPMSIAATDNYRKFFGGVNALPAMYFNLRQDTYLGNVKASEITDMQMNAEDLDPVVCGVAIDSKYDESSRKVDITAKITSNIKNNYRYLIFLVEDGIEYAQVGAEDQNNYIHNNVVRAVLSSSVNGDKIAETLEPGKEVSLSRSYTLASDWNANNMRVVVVALTSFDGGKTYGCNNSNYCPVGDSANYLRKKGK